MKNKKTLELSADNYLLLLNEYICKVNGLKENISYYEEKIAELMNDPDKQAYYKSENEKAYSELPQAEKMLHELLGIA